jgi:hypothetical protein
MKHFTQMLIVFFKDIEPFVWKWEVNLPLCWKKSNLSLKQLELETCVSVRNLHFAFIYYLFVVF